MGWKNFGTNNESFLQAIRVPWWLQNRLNVFAEQHNVTKTAVILRALDLYLQEYDTREGVRAYGYTYRDRLQRIEKCIKEGGTED